MENLLVKFEMKILGDPCTKFSEIKLENQQALTGLFFHDYDFFSIQITCIRE